MRVMSKKMADFPSEWLGEVWGGMGALALLEEQIFSCCELSSFLRLHACHRIVRRKFNVTERRLLS